jgi:hypothetical protein
MKGVGVRWRSLDYLREKESCKLLSSVAYSLYLSVLEIYILKISVKNKNVFL